MQDRFRFNAVVSGYYDVDTPEEYSEFEPQIYLENVDILNSGDIGVSRDDLEIAIKNQYPNLEKNQFNHIMKFFEDNSCSIDNEACLTILPYKIIQCTGLKDKNGKLIYEGDIVQIPDDYDTYGMFAGEKREIYFNEGGFRLKPKWDKNSRGNWLEDTEDFEVIGNIYHDSHLLENRNN